MITLNFKRGDTFIVQGAVTVSDLAQSLSGWTIASQVRNGSALLTSLTVTWVNQANGTYQLSAAPAATVNWPIKLLSCDIQYTSPSGQVISTDTFGINCQADVTQ